MDIEDRKETVSLLSISIKSEDVGQILNNADTVCNLHPKTYRENVGYTEWLYFREMSRKVSDPTGTTIQFD